MARVGSGEVFEASAFTNAARETFFVVWFVGTSGEDVAIDMAFGPMPGARTGVFVKHRLAALARKVIKQQAAADRAKRGHRRVIRHARRIANRQVNHQQVDDDRKSENRRIKKRDKQNAQATSGGDNRLKPVRQMYVRRR